MTDQPNRPVMYMLLAAVGIAGLAVVQYAWSVKDRQSSVPSAPLADLTINDVSVGPKLGPGGPTSIDQQPAKVTVRGDRSTKKVASPPIVTPELQSAVRKSAVDLLTANHAYVVRQGDADGYVAAANPPTRLDITIRAHEQDKLVAYEVGMSLRRPVSLRRDGVGAGPAGTWSESVSGRTTRKRAPATIQYIARSLCERLIGSFRRYH